MKASEAIIKCLEKEGVDTVFGYPGGAVLGIYEALRVSNINHVLVRHEQAAAHGASGYARSRKTTGVCIATSGPGATNLITGIATAYMDSIPLVVITGQVNSSYIGRDVFQEADILGATEPFTKHNYLIKDKNDIARVIKEAFYIASTGRPGPVLIDIPSDIQSEDIDFDYPSSVNIVGYKPTVKGHKGQIKKIADKIANSSRPLICVGGGIHCSNATEELSKYVDITKIPVVHTLMGIGGIPKDSPYYVGMLGSHGYSVSNRAIMEADLIIIIGARVGDRATANFKLSNSDTDIIHIDIDPAEVGKIISPTIPVVGDAKNVLNQLLKIAKPANTEEWLKHIKAIKSKQNKSEVETDKINPVDVMKLLSKYSDEDTIFTADVGKNQIWSARHLDISAGRMFLTSGGLGTMGYSLPAAIGAKISSPDRQVVCILGDGSFQMSLTELATLKEKAGNLTIILFNNNTLGMVRELQHNLVGKDRYHGVDFTCNPDFVQLANAYGIKGLSVSNTDDLDGAIKEALTSDETHLIECIVDKSIASTI